MEELEQKYDIHAGNGGECDNECDNKASIFLEHNIKIERPDDYWQENDASCCNQGTPVLQNNIKVENDDYGKYENWLQNEIKIENKGFHSHQESNWLGNSGLEANGNINVKCECSDEPQSHGQDHHWEQSRDLAKKQKPAYQGNSETTKKGKVCPICFEFFPSNLLLLRHEKSVHYHERPKVCNIKLPNGDLCLKRFKNNGALMMHARSHTGTTATVKGTKLCLRRGSWCINIQRSTIEKIVPKLTI